MLTPDELLRRVTKFAGQLPAAFGPVAQAVPTKSFPYRLAADAGPFALLPISPTVPFHPNAAHLGPGSVWISARLLASTSPVNSWIGFRIKAGGTLQAPGLAITPNEVTVQGIACTLTADLEPPDAPAAVAGAGADASTAVADLPKSIQIQFTPGHATIRLLSPFGTTVYGQRVDVTWSGGAPFYNDDAKEVFVPGDPVASGGAFTFGAAASQVFQPAGSSAELTAAWGLAVTIATPDKLPDAVGAGGIAIGMGPEITGTWAQSGAPAAFSHFTLQVSPGQIGVAAVMAAARRQTFQLWDEKPVSNGTVRPASIDAALPAGITILYVSSVTNGVGSEQMTVGAALALHADRPVGVDGMRLPYGGGGLVSIAANATGVFLIVQSAVAVKDAPLAIALENALAKVRAPVGLFAIGKLGTARVDSGEVVLTFPLDALLPVLPDPYAANFDSPLLLTGTLQSTVGWDAPGTAALSFAVQVASVQTPLNNPLLVGGGTKFNMVDVSSRADQLGVSWAPQGAADIAAQKLALAAQGNAISLFTVSEISWEPMQADVAIPVPPADGAPSQIFVPTVQLTPLAPLPLLDAQQAAVKGGAAVRVNTALPFGLVTAIDDSTGGAVSRFDLNQPAFATDAAPLNGGLQLTIAPPARPAKPEAPLFGGSTLVSGAYGAAVLGSDVSTIFTGQFSGGGGVPLERYDLSGYGASVFSEWADSNASGAAIVKAQFDVFVGRTAHDLIEAQSVIYPWGIKVVRTVIMDRRSGGEVVRVDTGWQAATPGEFLFPSATNEFAGTVHKGAIDGVYNVRRIRDNGAQLPPKNNIRFVPVLFDGDFKLNAGNPIVSGGAGGFTPAQDIVGYLQVGDFQVVPGQVAKVPVPVHRADLGDLLSTVGPVGGPVACTVNIGAAGQQMKATRVDVSVAFDSVGKAFFVPALRGTPVLPRDGAWSVGRKSAGSASTPVALDPKFAVPLIRNNASPNVWHLAEPADVLVLDQPNAIQVQYGMMQSTGTQKMFFGRPQVPQAGSVPAPVVKIPDAPHLADVGALLNATGFFPDLGAALSFPNPQDLALAGESNFGIAPPPFPVTAPAKTLVDFKVVQIVLDYRHKDGTPTLCTVKVDPAANPRWSIRLDGLSMVLVSPFGGAASPLLKVVGDVVADADNAPTLKNLEVVYGSFLSVVQEVFSRLQEIAKFLPGGQKVAGLEVSFSDGKLTIRQTFALPTLPLGLGEISDVALELGASIQLAPKSMTFTAGIGSPEKPFHWLVSLLSGTGCVQVGFQDDKPTILIQAGLGVGLEINVAVASGSASIVIALQVDNTVAPFEVKAILTGQASVDVLDGLASASITLSAGLGIVPAIVNPPEITLVGSVAVGIHISICWVVDVDFDGYWQFTQTLKSPVSVPLP